MMRLIRIRLFCVLVAVMMATMGHSAQIVSNGLRYDINSDGKTLTLTTSNPFGPSLGDVQSYDISGAVVIPSTITVDGTKYTVTAIGKRAFNRSSGITALTIPATVTSIGEKAFYMCSGLTRVNITDMAAWCSIDFAESWSNPLFYYDVALYLNGTKVTKLTVPSTVKSVKAYAFCDYDLLTSVTLPTSVTSIGESAFSSCNALTTVSLPNSLTSIGQYAFFCCEALATVSIPSKVTAIDKTAFSGCAALATVNWNVANYADLQEGESPFAGYTSIKTFTFGNTVKHVPAYLCYNLSGLSQVTISASVNAVGDHAFYGCSGLTRVNISDLAAWCKIDFYDTSSNPLRYAKKLYLGDNLVTTLTIPSTVATIKKYAFYNCASLTQLTIPQTVTTVDFWAFMGCSGLTDVTWGVPSCADFDWMSAPFTGLSNIETFVIASSVTRIPENLCYHLSGLTKLIIPSTVNSIGDNAFNNCKGLKRVINLAATPQTIANNVFNGVSKSNCLLIVPGKAVPLYRAATVWKDFLISCRGDVNGDGEVTSSDLACIVNVLAGLPDGEQFKSRADVNEDNEVTAADVGVVVNILAGLE